MRSYYFFPARYSPEKTLILFPKRSKQIVEHLAGHVTLHRKTATVLEFGTFVTVSGIVQAVLMKEAALTTRGRGMVTYS